MIILKFSGTKSWINFQLNQYWMSTVVQLIYLISTYSEDILHNLFSRKYFSENWLITEIMIMSFSSSNEVCSPIPVTFSKFGWAKIRTVKLPIQDSMMKLCKKKDISRRVRRLVSTLSQLLHFWKPLQLINILLWGIPKWKRRVTRLPLKSKKLGFKDLFCLAQL